MKLVIDDKITLGTSDEIKMLQALCINNFENGDIIFEKFRKEVFHLLHQNQQREDPPNILLLQLLSNIVTKNKENKNLNEQLFNFFINTETKLLEFYLKLAIKYNNNKLILVFSLIIYNICILNGYKRLELIEAKEIINLFIRASIHHLNNHDSKKFKLNEQVVDIISWILLQCVPNTPYAIDIQYNV